LSDWLPLNQDNYTKYNAITDDNEQIQFLNKILTGNVLSFAKGIDWTIDKSIITKIDTIDRIKTLRIKGVPRVVFNVSFKTNISMPISIGLGKNVSLGYGVVREDKRKRR